MNYIRIEDHPEGNDLYLISNTPSCMELALNAVNTFIPQYVVKTTLYTESTFDRYRIELVSSTNRDKFRELLWNAIEIALDDNEMDCELQDE